MAKYPLTFSLIAALISITVDLQAQTVRYDSYTVHNVPVNIKAERGSIGRAGGFRQARRKAWSTVWNRLTGQKAQDAPKVSDSKLAGLLYAFDIEQEEISAKGYQALITVMFDSQRTRSLVREYANLPKLIGTLLIVPLYHEAGVSYGAGQQSDWSRVWKKQRFQTRAINYVMSRGGINDDILFNAHIANRIALGSLDAARERYRVDGVLLAQAVAKPEGYGGAMHCYFALKLLDAKLEDPVHIVDFVLQVPDKGQVQAVFTKAVRRMHNELEAALLAGRIQIKSLLAKSWQFDYGYSIDVQSDKKPGGTASKESITWEADIPETGSVEEYIEEIPLMENREIPLFSDEVNTPQRRREKKKSDD